MDILQMSISASALIVAVIIIRALTLHKLPKKTFLVLWGVVICRLLIPFTIPFRFSFYTGIDMVKRMFAEKTAVPSPVGMTGIPSMVNMPSPGQPIEIVTPAASAAISPIEIAWLVGMCACALFFIVAYIKCRREFKTSLPIENDFVAHWLREHPLRRPVQIRQSDRIKAPLTYGVFQPVVLLPKTTDWTDEMRLRYILTHEFVHIRRFDTLTKLALAAAVCVHWFNPFVWVMYVLANRDIELSCDETVVRTFGETIKSAYALTLIGLEEKKNRLSPLVNNFSKNAIEERIVSIMKMEKTSLVGIMLALALVIVTTTVFATNAARATDAASGDTNNSDPSNSITTTGATITPSSVDFGTHMDIEMIKGGVFTVGRETWEKGDEIVFCISADEDMELYVGILPAESMNSGFGYNGYGQFIQKKVDVSSEVQEVSFTVPETGEYGIGVRHIKNEVKATARPAPETAASHIGDEDDNTALLRSLTDNEEKVNSITNTEVQDTVAFALEINKVFENPLVSSDNEGASNHSNNSNEADTELNTADNKPAIFGDVNNQLDTEVQFTNGWRSALVEPDENGGKYIIVQFGSLKSDPEQGVAVVCHQNKDSEQYVIDDKFLTPNKHGAIIIESLGAKDFNMSVVAADGYKWIFDIYNGFQAGTSTEPDNQSVSTLTADGQTTAESDLTLMWPVKGYDRVTSMFGIRIHPVSKTYTFCDHIEIAAPTGTSVSAALTGTVSEADYDDEQGNYIVITHDNGLETIYWYLSEMKVSKGDIVAAGDTIGKVGATGKVSGACLAFSVYVDGVATNPLEYYSVASTGTAETAPAASPEDGSTENGV